MPRAAAVGDAVGRCREQRPKEGVDLLGRAVVGVERDGDREPFGELAAERGEGARARGGVAVRACEVPRAADRDLDDPVRARVGEAAQRGVERLRGRDVDRGERVAARRGAVEHGPVLRGRRKHDPGNPARLVASRQGPAARRAPRAGRTAAAARPPAIP